MMMSGLLWGGGGGGVGTLAAGSNQTAWRSLYCHFHERGSSFVHQRMLPLRLCVYACLTLSRLLFYNQIWRSAYL
jgi:hypothetical protein